MHWRRTWQPTPVFLPGESQGWGSLVGCCLWVTQGRTQLKWLSSRAKLLSHQGDPFCSSAGNELRKLGSHLADRIILFDKQLKSICKQEQIGICHFQPPPTAQQTGPMIRIAGVLEVSFVFKLYRETKHWISSYFSYYHCVVSLVNPEYSSPSRINE